MGWRKQDCARFPFHQHALAGIFLALVAASVTMQAGATTRSLTEEELRHASARGWPDNLFRTSIVTGNGNVVEMFGDAGRLLSALPSPFDADIDFRDVIFNPANPNVVMDRNGTALIRVPDSIGEIGIRNIRVRGANGTSFGDVVIRNIDLRGTVIRVSRH
ncbi:MAG TPA: hypothetical protein VJ698_00435 [Noviherbaspirillum sp.]|uniref:hypothetical protein n=1 Tax=Noviherbaspirillum sp. TaxID=1926288 RepID=UPI002B47A741|nr:hypothetical protein [Noviherbaspirillum sp.]HJV83912.1 hypothetical protein [Noviherbaspirillum sp.]